jgi:hypothetical protein
MERPPGWRIETTAEFDEDFEALEASAPRAGQILESWSWYLERIPYRFSSGVSADADTQRVTSWTDEHDGTEYFAGLTTDDRAHVVLLRWLQVRAAD